MSKSIKKNKIRKGKDATTAIERKLVRNLIAYGKVKTTLKRAKILKAAIDRLLYKSLQKTESSYNVIAAKLGSSRIADTLINEIGPKFAGRTGGYVTLTKTGMRLGDGSQMAEIAWVTVITSAQEKNTPVKDSIAVLKGEEKPTEKKTDKAENKVKKPKAE